MNELLVASHIKPWSISDANEKLDIHNGLLMCPNHDKLFDRGYISFDDTGRILISEKLDDNNRMYMNITPTMKIDITAENIKYIKYHRKNVFIEKQILVLCQEIISIYKLRKCCINNRKLNLH